MKVRLKVRPELPTAAAPQAARNAALGLSSLLTPAALAAYALGCWRLTADLSITREFAISRGLFSHWQVWLGVGAVIHAGAITLARYGRKGRNRPAAAPAEVPPGS